MICRAVDPASSSKGPTRICAVFGPEADRLRTFLPGAVPAAVAATSDPFDVLGYAEVRSLDVQDAARAIRRFHESGQTVTIVSTNSTRALNTYLRSRALSEYVAGVSAREQARPLMLKPHPHLRQAAMTPLAADPADCIMIGDSVSDVHAAYGAHIGRDCGGHQAGKA